MKRINTITKKSHQNPHPAEGKKANKLNPAEGRKRQQTHNQNKKRTKKPPYTLMSQSKSSWNYSEHATAQNIF